ncbi:MAG: SDR family NAD(P)-dependent oxidoreductase [Bacteroidota bacterium]
MAIINTVGKFALVTGASSGIGWHFSGLLAAKGYRLVAVSNQPEKLEDLKKHLEKLWGIEVLTYLTDLAREKAAAEVFAFCETHNLHVEVLVNNAGMMVYGEMTGTGYDQVRSILQLHMTTPAMLCRLFGEKMKARRSGYILNVSSISAVMPYPTISLYGPTKTFLRYFSRAIRTELRPYGIAVTCLMPGSTATSLNDTDSAVQDMARLAGKPMDPAKVARAGLTALFRNRPRSVPGMLNKAIVLLVPVIPHFLIACLFRRQLRPASENQHQS